MNEQKRNTRSGLDMVGLSVQMTPPEPPPIEVTTPFYSIQEWLTHICDTNQPNKNITDYHFSLTVISFNNILSLVGINTNGTTGNIITRQIEFEPITHKYFALPKTGFENKSQQFIESFVLDELLKFIKTPKFHNSLLSKASSIRTSFSGQIWPVKG